MTKHEFVNAGDCEPCLFYMRKDDVLELHRLLRLYFPHVFEAASRNLDDPQWVEKQKEKFKKEQESARSKLKDLRHKKRKGPLTAEERRAFDKLTALVGREMTDEDYHLTFLFTSGKVCLPNCGLTAFISEAVNSVSFSNVFLPTGPGWQQVILRQPPHPYDLPVEYGVLHQENSGRRRVIGWFEI